MKVVFWFQSHPYHRLKLKQNLDTFHQFHQSSVQETWYLIHLIRFTMPRIVCRVSPAFGDFSQSRRIHIHNFFPRANIVTSSTDKNVEENKFLLILRKLCCTNHFYAWDICLLRFNCCVDFGWPPHGFSDVIASNSSPRILEYIRCI